MGRGAIAEVEHNLVHVTPSPAFGWVIAFDDRMAYCESASWRGGSASRRNSQHGRRFGIGVDGPTANLSSDTPRSRARSASRREWRRRGCIRRTSLSPGVGGERGFVAGFGEKGVQRGYHLCALPDRRRNALDRSRAHVADREYAGQAGFERSAGVRVGAYEALGVERHAGPGQPFGIRLRADE